jgi:hypothetical protein
VLPGPEPASWRRRIAAARSCVPSHFWGSRFHLHRAAGERPGLSGSGHRGGGGGRLDDRHGWVFDAVDMTTTGTKSAIMSIVTAVLTQRFRHVIGFHFHRR